MTYRIFDVDIGLLIAQETEVTEFFPEDEPRITHRLAIVSEIEAEAKMTIRHFHLPLGENEIASKFTPLKGLIAIFDASSQSSISQIADFLTKARHVLQSKQIILIGVDTKNAAIDFVDDTFLTIYHALYVKVTTRKELDMAMRGFGSRIIQMLRSEKDA